MPAAKQWGKSSNSLSRRARRAHPLEDLHRLAMRLCGVAVPAAEMAFARHDEESDSSSGTPPSSPPVKAATVVRRRQFDDEEDDSDVLDSWDAAEDSEVEREKERKAAEVKAKAAAAAAAAKKPKVARIAEKKALRALERDDDDSSSDEETEGERRERLRRTEQEADLGHAADLFGEIGINPRRATAKPVTVSVDSKDPNSTVDISKLPIFTPQTKAQFEKLRDTLTPLITVNSKKAHYGLFLQEFTKQLAKDLPSDQIKKLNSVLTALGNEKMREEKAAEKGGKKSKAAKNKTALVIGRTNVADMGTYDDDGLMLCASVDDEQAESSLIETKQNVRKVLRKLTRNSESQASIDCTAHTLHYLLDADIVFLCICAPSYPRKLAFTYLSDLAREFTTTYTATQIHNPALRPYAFMEFDNFIAKTKTTYADARASQNLDKLNDELRDVTKVMTKNIEDLLYRGDSLERMGEISSRLRDDSKKYRRAAVRINWELLLKQYGPFAALGCIMLFFFYWRFF
ncbi:hypothetical protein G7046_g7268 [Stylonectria norvegica]|nr:hypothetical protein G7046_g7268 [Stylonectria norvegica]